IYRIYDFHLNGFVWNLVFTRGGLDSLGGSTATTLTFVAICLGFVVLQVLLLLAVLRLRLVHATLTRAFRRRWTVTVSLAVVFAALFSQTVYGLATIRGDSPVLAASGAFPGYFPITFTRLA